MKKRLVLVLCLALILSLFAGCSSAKPAPEGPSNVSEDTSSEEAPAPKTFRLGVIDFSMSSNPTAMAYSAAQADLAATTGIELVKTPLTGYDDAAFMTAYESLINQGIDGAVVTTFSEGAIPLIANMLEENGIAWFLVNRQISNPELKEQIFNMDTFVGNVYCNEEEIAYDMVRQLIEDFNVKNLAVIGLTQGDLNGDLRDKGIARACDDFGVTFLTETRGIASVDDVTNSVESIIASYPELDGLFIVGGAVTNGALAGAAQALANNGLIDKVSIAMIDISTGMSDYMGEGQPLKLVAGGNTVLDQIIGPACLVNHFQGINSEDTPYVVNTRMMYIYNGQDADDFDEYVESNDPSIISGEAWYDTLLGKSVDEIQDFLDTFSIQKCKELRG